MKPFMADRRKMFELLPLPLLITIVILFSPTSSMSILFTFGYIWNWTVSQPLLYVQENSRYKFSTLKLVKNIHQLFLRPISDPKLKWVAKFVSILPAGLFWGLIAHSFSSSIPWWMCFVGSLSYEMIDLAFNKFLPHDGPPPL